MNLELRDIHKIYGETVALESATLTLPERTGTLVLIGPSGGGKSTLLRLLGGLETPDSGTISIAGSPLGNRPAELLAYRRRNGFLFQSFNLFPHINALDNITLPLRKVHTLPEQEAQERAHECLARFGLGDHTKKRPAELSGGQQQRVALARAIAHRPEMLILDEPTSALDPEMTSEVLDLIEQLRDGGQNIVLSTHEMGFARKIADHIAFLADGRIEESGQSQQLFENPENTSLRNFLSKVTRFA